MFGATQIDNCTRYELECIRRTILSKILSFKGDEVLLKYIDAVLLDNAIGVVHKVRIKRLYTIVKEIRENLEEEMTEEGLLKPFLYISSSVEKSLEDYCDTLSENELDSICLEIEEAIESLLHLDTLIKRKLHEDVGNTLVDILESLNNGLEDEDYNSVTKWCDILYAGLPTIGYEEAQDIGRFNVVCYYNTIVMKLCNLMGHLEDYYNCKV